MSAAARRLRITDRAIMSRCVRHTWYRRDGVKWARILQRQRKVKT